jgi:hypothetical protein
MEEQNDIEQYTHFVGYVVIKNTADLERFMRLMNENKFFVDLITDYNLYKVGKYKTLTPHA